MDLPYDGSFLGSIELKDVKWYAPVTDKGRMYPDLYAILDFKGKIIPCILSQAKPDDDRRVIVDECKPIFGIEKIGIHRFYGKFTPYFESNKKVVENVRLKFSRIRKLWYLYRVDWETKDTIVILPFVPLEDEDISSKRIFPLIQRTFLFRKLFRMRSPKTSIMMKHRSLLPRVPISYEEGNCSHVLEEGEIYGGGKISYNLEKTLFPTFESKLQTLDLMIGGLSSQNLLRVKNEIEKVIMRINKNYISLRDSLFDDICNIIDTS